MALMGVAHVGMDMFEGPVAMLRGMPGRLFGLDVGPKN